MNKKYVFFHQVKNGPKVYIWGRGGNICLRANDAQKIVTTAPERIAHEFKKMLKDRWSTSDISKWTHWKGVTDVSEIETSFEEVVDPVQTFFRTTSKHQRVLVS